MQLHAAGKHIHISKHKSEMFEQKWSMLRVQLMALHIEDKAPLLQSCKVLQVQKGTQRKSVYSYSSVRFRFDWQMLFDPA